MPLFQKAWFSPPFVMYGELKDFACFFYMVEGSMASYDFRGLHKIGKNEALLKNCGSYVQHYNAIGVSDKCAAIAVYLYPELLKEIYKNEVPSFLLHKQMEKPKKLIGNRLIEQYMNNLSVFFEDSESMDEELGILKLKELMMILLRSENHEDIRKLLSEIFSPVNVKFKEAINNNLYNSIGLEELAFICNMSLSTFKREFKKIYEDTPAHYLKGRRLEKAASLLLCNDDAISDIAFESGFLDATTFSANFQEKYGQSPSTFRLTRKSK